LRVGAGEGEGGVGGRLSARNGENVGWA
jgi:hypothetical protein